MAERHLALPEHSDAGRDDRPALAVLESQEVDARGDRPTATGSGTSHTVAKTCTCEVGDWTYIVKSTRPGFTPRGSDTKTFRVNACVD